MLADNLKDSSAAAALDAWDPAAIVGGDVAHGETTLFIEPSKIPAVCAFLKSSAQFNRLSGVTCIDRYPLEPRFELVYLLHSIPTNQRLKLKAALPSESPQVESVCGVWEGANWYEREVFDLFGVTFLNHPDLRRIMMPESWEGHPLRRDFPVHGHKYSYQND